MPAGLGRPGSSMEGPCLQMMLSLWGPPSLGPREAAFLRSQQFYFAQLSLFPRVVGQSSLPYLPRKIQWEGRYPIFAHLRAMPRWWLQGT